MERPVGWRAGWAKSRWLEWLAKKMQGAAGSKADAAMAQMQKQMAAMSPEQRKMVEDMMAKKGMQMGAAPGGGMAVKVCLTPEMA